MTEQKGKGIRGTFELRPQLRISCDSREAGFCSENLSAKFCRQISGTFQGEAFSSGAREPLSIYFKFGMEVEGTIDAVALGRVTGCPVTRGDTLFHGGVYRDAYATADAQVTVDCGGAAGLGRIDLAVLLSADRVSVER